MVIDFHTHLAIDKIYPEYWLSGMGEDLKISFFNEKKIQLKDEFVRNIINNSLKDYNGEKMIREMNDAEIDRVVVLLADLFYDENPDISLLEEIYKIHYDFVARFPDRYYLFGGVDPRRGEAGLALFRKGIEVYGFRGLKLYPPCGYELNDPILFPFYELCSINRLPVLTHIGPSLKGMKNESLYPGSVLDISDRYPGLRFILGHAGLIHFEESKDLPLMRENLYLEISGFQIQMEKKELIGKKLRYLFDHCPEKVIFGTDWPLFNSRGSQKSFLNYFRDLRVLSNTELDLFFWKNAARLVNLS